MNEKIKNELQTIINYLESLNTLNKDLKIQLINEIVIKISDSIFEITSTLNNITNIKQN